MDRPSNCLLSDSESTSKVSWRLPMQADDLLTFTLQRLDFSLYSTLQKDFWAQMYCYVVHRI